MIDLKTILPKELKTKNGVYSIQAKHNGKYYFGSTTSKKGFICRWRGHLYELRNNIHINKRLQRAYNKYGEDNFEFKIRVVCKKEFCVILEQKYLDICLKAKGDIETFWKMGYNSSPNANSGVVYQYAIYKKKGIENPAKGRKYSEAAKLKMSKSIGMYDLQGNFIKSWLRTPEAAKELNLSRRDIAAATEGKQPTAYGYQWIRPINGEFPEKIKEYTPNYYSKEQPLKVLQYDLNGDFIRYFNRTSIICKNYNLDASCVVKCCDLKIKQHKGFQFRYYTDSYSLNIGKVKSKFLNENKD